MAQAPLDISLLSFLFAIGGTVASVVASYAIMQTKVNSLTEQIAELKQNTVTKEVLQLHLKTIETQISQVVQGINDMKDMMRGRPATHPLD